jgi:hypothetical protein
VSLSCIIFSSISLARCPIAGCSRPLKQSSLSLSLSLSLYNFSISCCIIHLSLVSLWPLPSFIRVGRGGNVEACSWLGLVVVVVCLCVCVDDPRPATASFARIEHSSSGRPGSDSEPHAPHAVLLSSLGLLSCRRRIMLLRYAAGR